ncbi:hypothetical protein I4U23_005781 [Adineta vaga]|nr:hypothetical protein I4U23_005781 [Adineta vaga]
MNEIVSSRLEIFPNELFIEIFQYIQPINLRCFKGLNKRLDSIIQILKVNFVIQYQDDDEINFLETFSFEQIFSLKIQDCWSSMNLIQLCELRSLSINCTYLTKQQLDQILEIHLLYLERLTIENIAYDFRELLIYKIFHGKHFPSLNICQLKLGYGYNLEFDDKESIPNNIIRSFSIDKWEWSELGFLLHQLTHLNRLEINFEESLTTIIDPIQPNFNLKYLRITLDDPINNLEKILKWTPNLIRLYICGNLINDDINVEFEKMAKYLSILTPHLQQFNCELYFHTSDHNENEFIIQKLHRLFKQIRDLDGGNGNRCFATDFSIYPHDNKYEIFPQPIARTISYKRYSDHEFHCGYRRYYGYNDFDYGLDDYCGDCEGNCGCSSWCRTYY